ncbi:MAG: hypothetical protein IKK48_05955, partial [Firmicutes bacterium]|nr:hypothetical protein [Bacillota bacterium]
MKRKFVSIMCILALVFTTVVPVSALESPVEGEARAVSTSYLHVNPNYEDCIDVAALKTELQEIAETAVQPFAEEEYLRTPLDIAEVLREAMVNRQGNVIVQYAGGEYTQDMHDEIIALAFMETDNPKEGDYLGFQYGGCGADVSGDVIGGVYYLTLSYNISYYTTAKQEKELDEAVARVLDEIHISDEMGDYDKVCAIYDYICHHVTYDYDHLGNESYKLQYTAYAALMHGTSVCQGYANLFYRLAKEAGLSARIVRGWQTSTGGAHAWNIVKLGDQYYNLDATWDTVYAEAGYDYAFFLKGWDAFEDHSFDAQYVSDAFMSAYPMATTDYVDMGEEKPEPKPVSGLVPELEDVIYTGKAIEPAVVLYDGDIQLIEGKDYILTYRDNIDVGHGLLIVTYIGAYCGEEKCDFRIMPADIGAIPAEKLHFEEKDFFYSGDKNEPVVTIDGLIPGLDYVVEYENHVNAGEAKAVIKGVNNYAGIIELPFIIHPLDINRLEDVYPSLESYYYCYTGSQITPEVSFGNLTEGVDYHVSYGENTQQGEGFVYVQGTGNYCGEHVLVFEICASSMDSITATPVTVTYDGLAHGIQVEGVPEDATVTYAYNKNGPFTAQMPRITDVGTLMVYYKVSKPGYGDFLGQSFVTVEAKPLTKTAYAFEFSTDASFSYTGQQLRPACMITDADNGTMLVENRDYTVSYGENLNVGEGAVTITGCGNYTGAFTHTFVISPCSHTFGEWVETKEASCEEPGEMTRICAGCSEPETKSIEELGHSYGTSYTVDKKATTSADGSKSKHCTRSGCTAKSSVAAIPKIASVTLSTTKYTYTGYSKTPTVTVKDAKGNILKKDTDYTVTYPSSRWDVGRYKVTIKMKGSYLSTFYRYYTIVPKAPSSASAYLTSYYGQYTGYDDVRFTWSKARGASGYYVYYKKSTSDSYTYLTKTTSTSVRKKDLTDGVKYIFKVVPYYKSGDTNYISLSYTTASVYTLKKLAAPTVT